MAISVEDIDTIAEEAQAQTLPPGCLIGNFIAEVREVNPANADKIKAYVNDIGYHHAALLRLLNKLGCDFKAESVVRKHRSHKCSCERAGLNVY